jgi:hypothetical protein
MLRTTLGELLWPLLSAAAAANIVDDFASFSVVRGIWFSLGKVVWCGGWVGWWQVILDFLRLEWKFLASWNLQWSDVVSGFSRQ